jgi:vesicle-associated membrane protein 7
VREAFAASTTNFNKTLGDLMVKYNDDRIDNLTAARRNLEEVNDIMKENLEKVIDRGIKIEVLEEKTEQLEEGAIGFRKQATKLKNKMCW